MKKSFIHALNTLTLAVVGALSVQPPAAQAAFVVVVADPLFGSAYPGQGWGAEGALYIPDACYASVLSASTPSTFFQLDMGTNSLSGCSGNFLTRSSLKLTNMKVKLYNNVPSNVFDNVILGDYLAENGQEAFYGNNALARLIDIGFVNGQVVSFHTTLSTSTPTNVPLVGNTSTQLQLQFSKDYVATPGNSSAVNCNNTVAGKGTILCVAGLNGTDPRTLNSTAPLVEIGQVLTDAQYEALNVPEPGSLGLGVTALAAAWLARRRRSRRSA